MRKQVMNEYKHNLPCHICGLPIPFVIVDPRHPLLGTIDHIIPRSRGGSNRADNRAPAHRCCNALKNSFDLTDEVREKAKHLVLRAFSEASDEVFAVLNRHYQVKRSQAGISAKRNLDRGRMGKIVLAQRKRRASFSMNPMKTQYIRMIERAENGE